MEKVWKINYRAKLGEMEWSWNVIGMEMKWNIFKLYSMKSGKEMERKLNGSFR